MISALTSHLSTNLSSKSIIVFLISAMLVSILVFIIENKNMIRILIGHKHKAVKQIKPGRRFCIYKTEGYFTRLDAMHFNVYTPHFVQEHLSRDTTKVLGKVTGPHNECLLVFKDYYLIYALFDLSYIYDVMFNAFVTIAQKVFLYSIGVTILCQILLSQL